MFYLLIFFIIILCNNSSTYNSFIKNNLKIIVTLLKTKISMDVLGYGVMQQR